MRCWRRTQEKESVVRVDTIPSGNAARERGKGALDIKKAPHGEKQGFLVINQ